jgi:hypothetical protein
LLKFVIFEETLENMGWILYLNANKLNMCSCLEIYLVNVKNVMNIIEWHLIHIHNPLQWIKHWIKLCTILSFLGIKKQMYLNIKQCHMMHENVSLLV